MVDFVTQNGPIFHNIQNICGHKSETMQCTWSKVGMGGEHHRYYKHTKFRQNLRGDPKFLVDLTQNDPYLTMHNQSATFIHCSFVENYMESQFRGLKV